MPSIIRTRLSEILNNPPVIRAADTTFDQFRRHKLRLRDTGLLDDTTVQEILSRIQHGEAVLCVATTVKRAQQLQSLLQAHLKPESKVSLLHSRFNSRDRSHKEKELRDLMSTGVTRSTQVVLVATQVVEVSLDVDFDVLFTDPAPLEALVQRFGRVNRGRRPQPHDVIVCTTVDDALPVYSRQLVEAAIERLRRSSDQIIDERDVQKWLDIIYNGEIGKTLSDEIEKESKAIAKIIADVMPFDSNDDLEELFYEQFEGTEVLPKSLVPEYKALLDTNPMGTGMLTVPISKRQLQRLCGQKRVEKPNEAGLPKKGPLVVNVHYDSDSGLNLDLDPIEENS